MAAILQMFGGPGHIHRRSMDSPQHEGDDEMHGIDAVYDH